MTKIKQKKKNNRKKKTTTNLNCFSFLKNVKKNK